MDTNISELDCRGLACPAPVLKTRDALEEGAEGVKVRVDNQAASINVKNFLTSQAFEVTIDTDGDDWIVTGLPGGGCEIMSPEEMTAETARILVFMGDDKIGRGDDELGRKLMLSYLETLEEMGPALWRIVLVNDAVKMTVGGTETAPLLQRLVDQGVSLLVCGTCLTFFGLMDQKVVGDTTNMLDVVTSHQLADKVISIT